MCHLNHLNAYVTKRSNLFHSPLLNLLNTLTAVHVLKLMEFFHKVFLHFKGADSDETFQCCRQMRKNGAAICIGKNEYSILCKQYTLSLDTKLN